MKTVTLFFLLFCITIQAQVGIGTVTPQATLDITGEPGNTAELDGVIAPRITGAQLQAKTYGAAQTAAIVFVTLADPSPAGQTIDVTQVGYYYFNGTIWIALTPGKDGDFYEVGTTSPPDDINDNVFRTGNVAIGLTSPNYALDVRSDTEAAAVNITKGGSATGANYGLQVTNFNSAKGEHVGVRSIVNFNTAGTDTDRHYGVFTRVRGLNPTTGVNTNQNIGVYNQLDFGAGNHTGVFNSLSGTQDSENIGTSNFIANTGNGTHTGTSNLLKANGGVGDTGTGDKIGNYTGINNSLGDNYGTYNEIFSTVAGKSAYGTFNDVNSDTGTLYAGWFDAHGSGANENYFAAVFNRGHVVANESAGDFDFRIEGQTDANLFFADASTNNVGIGTATPGEKLEVNGTIKATDINFSGLLEFSNNANAISGGLSVGDVYMDTGGDKGILRIVY